MDRDYWRKEAAMLRREGQHMLDVADELGRAAQEPTRHEPPQPAQPASFAVRAGIAAVGFTAAAGLLILALFRNL